MINYVVSAVDFNSLLPKIIAAFEAFGGRKSTLPPIILKGENTYNMVDHNSLNVLEELLSKIYTNIKDRPNQYFPSAQYNKLKINPKWKVKLIFSHNTDDYIKQPRFDTFTFSDGTKNVGGSEAAKFIEGMKSMCPCNCNYSCTCQCNYCSCNCNYSCTCQCNYSFWDAPAPSCSCHCNYSCTCQCNYTSHWTTTEHYTEEKCIDYHETYTVTEMVSPGCTDGYTITPPTYETRTECWDNHYTFTVDKTREVPHSSYSAGSTGPSVVRGRDGRSIFSRGSNLSSSVVIGRPGRNREEPEQIRNSGSKPNLSLSTYDNIPETFTFHRTSTARTGLSSSVDPYPSKTISDPSRYSIVSGSAIKQSCKFHMANLQNEVSKFRSTLNQYYVVKNWKPEVIVSTYVCVTHTESSICGYHMNSSHSKLEQWRSATRTSITKEGWPTD